MCVSGNPTEPTFWGSSRNFLGPSESFFSTFIVILNDFSRLSYRKKSKRIAYLPRGISGNTIYIIIFWPKRKMSFGSAISV